MRGFRRALLAHSCAAGVCLLAIVSVTAIVAHAQQTAPIPHSVLSLTDGDLPQAIVGVSFHSSVGATGGSGVYNFLVAGQLPPGITLERGAATLAISGVPTAAGSYQFEVSVADVRGGSINREYTITVQPNVTAQLAQPGQATPQQSSGNAIVTDVEGFHFTDVDSIFFPTVIIDAEAFHFTDAEGIFFPAMLLDPEAFHFTDVPDVFFPDRQPDAEAFHFGDTDVVMASAMFGDTEGFHFGDTDVVTTKIGISPSVAPSGSYNTSYSATFTPVGYTGTPSITESGTLPTGIVFQHVLNQTSVTITGTPTVTGSFPFTLTATDSANGNTTTVSYTLIIGAESQTITIGALPSPIYGGAHFTLTANASPSGLPVTIASTSALATGTNPFTPVAAGVATFQATQAGNTDYSAATPVNFSVTIAPATLSVTAGSISRIFDQPNPAFTTSINGFVNGDPSSVVSGAPTVSTAATPISSVSGSPYAITPALGTLAATNYTFSFVTGSLSIKPTTQTITFYPIANLTHGATFELSARSSSGLPITYTVTGGAIANNILTVGAAGPVTVTATQAGNANYSAATSVMRSFTAQ
jgi:hypothetical protein